ncbi:MAG TPA: hypothetical protein VM824_13925 [Thermoleophilaceae bacterium]|nr:hypothetical protein [Thermoleophilaceae bacterium]
MRNRALHDALRNFALEAAALLTDDLKDGAEVEFDVVDEGGGRGPALYRYEPRTGSFIEERWQRLRELPSREPACRELGAGASAWLRVNGLRGEQAEPALRAMLERLYEDATSFGFPEERFERVYGEVELTLYRDAVRARVIAPLPGAWMHAERVELGDGLSLARGDAMEGPHDRTSLLCVLERDVPADDPIPADEAAERFASVVTAMRLWAPGSVSLVAPGWRQSDQARWQPVPIGSSTRPRGGEWMLPAGDEQAFREFFTAISVSERPPHVAWALDRFEMGAAQETDAEALTDHLLGLRALLDATTDTGQASFGLRLAALCAEEGTRGELQERMETATRLERYVMGHSSGASIDTESPRELVAEVEGHLRALLRDVLCGYLEADLKSVADDILIESHGEPLGEIEAHDMREEPAPQPAPEPPTEHAPRFHREEVPTFENPLTFEPDLEWEAEPDYEPEYEAESDEEYDADYDDEPDTAEIEPVAVTAHQPVQHQPDGVTESADWGWDDPEDFSAPV